MHMKFECLLSKSLTTLEVMTHYLVVHTGPDLISYCRNTKRWKGVGGGEGGGGNNYKFRKNNINADEGNKVFINDNECYAFISESFLHKPAFNFSSPQSSTRHC